MIKELIFLLKCYPKRTNVSGCLKAIEGTEEFRYRNSDTENETLPLNYAIDIYHTRSRINSKLNNGTITGYEELLPSLENATVETVRIISLEMLDRWYVIFTNIEVSELYGVLNSPKKKAVWFSKITDYN